MRMILELNVSKLPCFIYYQYYTNATICLLLILLQDVDTTNTKMVVHDGSTSQHAQSLKLPKPPEFMAFEASYQQLMSLVSERPVDYARRAFSRALIDTLKLDEIRSSLVTDEEKATELLREIGQMIRTSVPQAFERFLLILNTHPETPVVQQLTSMTIVYKVLTEFQKLSTSELNLDALAKEFLIHELYLMMSLLFIIVMCENNSSS